MANPTGTNFFASVAMNTDPVTDAPYTWADGDVYKLAQTDMAEAAAPGASFAGLGVQNQPASKLLNKVNLIRAAQLDDEANISGLETFKAAFAGLVGGAYRSGYIKIPIQMQISARTYYSHSGDSTRGTVSVRRTSRMCCSLSAFRLRFQRLQLYVGIAGHQRCRRAGWPESARTQSGARGPILRQSAGTGV